MYQIWANDEVLLYDSTIDDYKIAAGSGVLETNKAGSFTFTIFPDHFYYYKFIKKRTVITVRKSGKILFRGRVLDDKLDYWKRKTNINEGELNFLRDSFIPDCTIGTNPPADLAHILEKHNSCVDDSKKFNIGTVTVIGSEKNNAVEVTGLPDAMEVISNLLDTFGGYLVITHGADGTDPIPTLNWLVDPTDIADQSIEFGVNLRDFAKTGNGQEIATCIIPLSEQEDGSVLDISSVNGGLAYVQNDDAVALRGKIFKRVYFDGITDQITLKNLALDMLSALVKEEITVTLTALDLHMLDRSIESYGVNQYIRCVSPPHDFAETLLCYKQTFDLLRPQNDTIVLGGTCRSLTGSITKMAASGGKVDLSDVNNKISGLQSSMSTAQADIRTNAGNVQKLNVKTEEYKTAQQQMNNLLAKSFGVFHTAEAQTDGSTIHYLHDKPTLAGSTTIWKMTGDAFMVSTDGGKTYSAGMDSSGNAMVNILSAIGIEASWINCDNLKSLSANLGGWLIDGTKIYKEIRHPSNSSIRYRVYFKPPVQSTGAVATEILTCEISRNSGSTWTDLLTIDADGSALFHSEDKGTYKIHGSFMELIDANGVQIARMGTQNRVSVELQPGEVLEEEVMPVADDEVLEEEIVEEVLEEVYYDNKFIPELVLREDSDDEHQVVVNPAFIQFGDSEKANQVYLRRNEDGRYVLRVDAIEIKDRDSNKMAYLKYEGGRYKLKVDDISVDYISSHETTHLDADTIYATDSVGAGALAAEDYVDAGEKFGVGQYWGYTGWVNGMYFEGGILCQTE